MESNDIAEKMAANEAKGGFIEKVSFAILPFLLTCIVYLMSALSDSNHRITILEGQVQSVVTDDELQALNNELDLAREKLRQDFMNSETESLGRHTENKGELKLLSWRIQELERNAK